MFGKSAPSDPSPMADAIDLDDEATMKAMASAARRSHRSRYRCRRCRYLYDPAEEAAIVRKQWCSRCETDWWEAKLNRLVDRFGRKAALAAVRRLLK